MGILNDFGITANEPQEPVHSTILGDFGLSPSGGVTGEWNDPVEHGLIHEGIAGLGRGVINVVKSPFDLLDVGGELVSWKGLENISEAASERLSNIVKENPWLQKSHSISHALTRDTYKGLMTDPNFYVGLVSEGIPTILSMIIPGTIAAKGARALGWGAKALEGTAKVAAIGKRAQTAQRIAGFGAAIGLEAGGAAGEVKLYEQSTGKEVPIWKKVGAIAATGVAAGSVEYLPIISILGKKASVGLVQRILSGFGAAAWEGGTEGVQELIANACAKYGYNPDKEMIEGFFESVIAGALLGGGMAHIRPSVTLQDKINNASAAEIVGILEMGETEWKKHGRKEWKKGVQLQDYTETPVEQTLTTEQRKAFEDLPPNIKRITESLKKPKEEQPKSALKDYKTNKATYSDYFTAYPKHKRAEYESSYKKQLTKKQKQDLADLPESVQHAIVELKKSKEEQWLKKERDYERDLRTYSKYFVKHPEHKQLKYDRPSVYRKIAAIAKAGVVDYNNPELGSIIPPKEFGDVPDQAITIKPGTKWYENLPLTVSKGETVINSIVNRIMIMGQRHPVDKTLKENWRLDVIDPQFISVARQIKQGDVDGLFSAITESKLSVDEKYIAQQGLTKLFGGHGKAIMTKLEHKTLTAVFSKDFLQLAQANQYNWQSIKNSTLDVINIPKAIMASTDLSAPLRQGFLFLTSRPKRTVQALGEMMKTGFSGKGYQAVTKNIGTDRAAKVLFNKGKITEEQFFAANENMRRLYSENGLAITQADIAASRGIKDIPLNQREEAFMSSYAEKIPYIGPVVKWSNRTYSAYLNTLRTQVFQDFVATQKQLGIKDPHYLKSAADYINVATGRGNIPFNLNKYANELNAVFFSPRLITARLQSLNPVFYTKLHPKVRKQALKDVFITAGSVISVLGLASLAGMDVEKDPRSSNFGKIRPRENANVKLDILGGFSPLLRSIAQLICGNVKLADGSFKDLGGSGYGRTHGDIVQSYFKNKLSPAISFAWNWVNDTSFGGGPFNFDEQTEQLFVPMWVQDMQELLKEDDTFSQTFLWSAGLAFFGTGLQVYGGVMRYGLEPRKHRFLNAELNRLKISLPSIPSSAYSNELTIKERKRYIAKVGPEMASRLEEIIRKDNWLELSTKEQRHRLTKMASKIKRYWVKKMFWQQRRKQAFDEVQAVKEGNNV